MDSRSAGNRDQPARPCADAGEVVVQVALPLPLPKLFDYRCRTADDQTSTLAGRRVRVPFGTGERIGIIVNVMPLTPDRRELKWITTLLDPEAVFDSELWQTVTWAASYYHHPLGEVLHAAMPKALRRGDALPGCTIAALMLSAAGKDACDRGALRPGPGKSLLDLLAAGPLPLAEVREHGGASALAAARRLRQRGWVEDVSLEQRSSTTHARLDGPPLNIEQQAAIDRVDLTTPGFRALLLDGVTGSGKTEVYLQLIEQTLAAGRQALVLVPEIALTPQALQRYRERLAAPVLALHSGLSDGERSRAWAQARSGRPCVVLGTRSAVFSPLPEAGLMIVDEEHDGSYKQGDGFRYHARDLALVRAKTRAVPIVLGSATPSLEMLALVSEGRMQRLRLSRRAAVLAKPPQLRLIDVRRQHLVGGLGAIAVGAVAETLAGGGQALVFRNRRGYALMLSCPACGWHCECPRCDRAMTLHRELASLICHHCGRRQRVPTTCPDCDHPELDARGVGTERIENELRQRFPGQRLLRIDRDSVRTTARLDAALNEIADGAPAILIGTQLLAKGHDWPALTLVVVVDADQGLFSPDFRAPERLAQLLTQVAGRAGRGDRPGTVLIQTRQPEHLFWSRWLGGGHAAVAEAELADRRASALPPFRHQALLAAEARQRTALDAFFAAATALPEPAAATGVDRLGPMPAPMPRRAGHHRTQLLLESDSRAALHGLLSAWIPRLYALPTARRVRWSLDVDPYDLY